MSLMVIQGPVKTGKTTLIQQMASLAGRELVTLPATIPLHAQAPFSAPELFHMDIDKVDKQTLEWILNASQTIDIIVETRHALPMFNVPAFTLAPENTRFDKWNLLALKA